MSTLSPFLHYTTSDLTNSKVCNFKLSGVILITELSDYSITKMNGSSEVTRATNVGLCILENKIGMPEKVFLKKNNWGEVNYTLIGE